LILAAAKYASAQSIDSLKKTTRQHYSDSSLNSLSVFELIDSLVQMPSSLQLGSTFVTRLGYNSNIVAAGRSLGFNQFGLSPGISYYHKTGLYVDATAYWSQEYSPELYLTVPSLGYLKNIKKWTFNLEYSRYIYSFSDSAYDLPYTNTIGLSNFFEVKPFLFRLDYSLYFGEKSVNRIMPAIMLNLEKRNWRGFKRILLYPTFNVLFGNETWQTSKYVLIFKNGLPLYVLRTKTFDKFGALNYSVSLPLSVAYKNWNFQLSYAYNFQQALTGEPITVTNSGYLSFNIVRYFNFKSTSVLTDLLKMTK
jgi:hypothetical protein